ncbi:MAG: sigma-70 family RNA polymerase sigma factor, partial [Steroidobacteraceae bacterium]
SRVTQLLIEWSGGNQAALGELMPLVYDELRRLAQRHLRHERAEHTLQRTALVNEAFLRLVNQRQIEWQSRSHFLALASQLMRRILVDHARGQNAAKRGSGVKPVSLDETAAAFSEGPDDEGPRFGDALAVAVDPAVDLVAIDEALTRFQEFDPRQSKIVELRFFGGLTIEDIAPVLGVSEATVKREWALARAWLRRELV